MSVELKVLPDHNRHSFRAEVIVPQASRYTLEDARYAFVSTRNNEIDVQVPVRVLYDDTLHLGTGIVSKTVAASLGLNTNQQHMVLTCDSVKHIPIARCVGVRYILHYPSHNALCAQFSVKTIKEIASTALMHQVFNDSSRFCVSDWLTVFVTCYDEPIVANNVAWIIDPGLTSITFNDTQSDHSRYSYSISALRNNILTRIFEEFFGSRKEIKNLINFVFNDEPSMEHSSEYDLSVSRRRTGAVLLQGAAGHGKTALLMLLQSIVGVERALYINMRNLSEATRFAIPIL